MEDSRVDDIELMKDPGFELKDSLNAAFAKKDITVSEDLISATLAKIRALESASTEPENTATRNIENTSAQVVNISDRKKKIRTIARIAIPVAAALFIGIIGINLINNGRMDSTNSPRHAAKNEAMSASDTKDAWNLGAASNSSESYAVSDTYGEEPAAVAENSMDDAFLNGAKTADAYNNTTNDSTAADPNVDYAPAATCAPTLSFAGTSDENEDIDTGSFGYRGTYGLNALYCFRVPEELVEKSMETVIKYIDASEETDELAATTGNGGYLVIGSDYVYFTTDESLEQEDGTIHHIVGSEDAAGEMAAEIEELLNTQE